MRVLIVDLNNFSRYPTLSVGYLSAVLRDREVTVEVLSPLSFGVHGFPRKVQEKGWQLYTNFIRHWSAVTEAKGIARLRRKYKSVVQPGNDKDSKAIIESVIRKLDSRPDIVLISAYTMYFDVCEQIAKMCAARNIPVMVGGNSFVVEKVAQRWHDVEGITAVYAGEPEPILYEIVQKLVLKEDISSYPGVYTPATAEGRVARPLTDLDRIPFPDFSDFPWQSYPNRIVPIMTGRGCEWGRCTFCSDVVTSAGRTYRSRSLKNVIQEVAVQRSLFDVNLFVFLDLKLNSNLDVWYGLAERLPEVAPGIKWTASVHVDSRADNGLSREVLQQASDAGLVRITCGLESGSPKVLSSMAKGIKLKRMADFVKDASDAGISVRLTCIIGDPSEEASDIDLTTDFIREHSQHIERITLNRFATMPGTPAEALLKSKPEKYRHIKLKDLDIDNAMIPHSNRRFSRIDNLKAVYKLLKVVNLINQKPLLERAKEFEGAF